MFAVSWTCSCRRTGVFPSRRSSRPARPSSSSSVRVRFFLGRAVRTAERLRGVTVAYTLLSDHFNLVSYSLHELDNVVPSWWCIFQGGAVVKQSGLSESKPPPPSSLSLLLSSLPPSPLNSPIITQLSITCHSRINRHGLTLITALVSGESVISGSSRKSISAFCAGCETGRTFLLCCGSNGATWRRG